ncbi:MAG: Xaa-Pro peptidase family protein [Parcubacteria group bacterium]|jgi:Xaa-Pro aminopeptidase
MARIIYASTQNSDMLYALKIHVSDPVFLLDMGKKKQYVFLDQREIGVFQSHNNNPDIEAVLLDPILDQAKTYEEKTNNANKLVWHLCKIYNLNSIEVPNNFPLDMADFLRSKKIEIKVQNPFYLDRTRKNKKEIEYVRQNVVNLCNAYEEIELILAESIIEGDNLRYRGEILTSEMLKRRVEHVLIDYDLIDIEGMIISSAEDAVVPHHRGSGPIKAHQPIICDIFPKSRKNGYFADMTRTYVKGRPSEALEKMYQAVLKVQERAVKMVRPGISARSIHDFCAQSFLDMGYDVGAEGFVHGTGHGLGLDIHEGPFVNKHTEAILEVGNIITVEPGLYYSGIGGVRIEDDIVVTEDGYENLMQHHKRLIIK